MVNQGHHRFLHVPDHVCEVCQLGKQHRHPFLSERNVSKGLLEVIHSDLWRPTQTTTIGGCRYFVTFIDDYSRHTWKHLRCREIIAFICRWQGCWGRGPWGWGLRARQIAIARSIVTPFLCPSRGPICVSRDWLVALVGVMGLKKVVIILCGWAGVAVFFNNFSRCLLSSSKKSPRKEQRQGRR